MKIAIIGGGASGLACAIECARKADVLDRKVEITVYEAKDRVGKKILATGNGRCNMMNENESIAYFGDDSFARYALKKFNVKSNLSFFASMGLYTRSDEEGRIYPLSNQASAVLDALRFECERLGVKFVCSAEIGKIKKTGRFFELGDGMRADKIVLACGGKAAVKGYIGYELLRNLGHRVIEPLPALSKLNVIDVQYTKQLKGVRHKAVAYLYFDGKKIKSETGEIQFVDYGLSGIAIMQLSSYITRSKAKKNTVVLDTVPDFSEKELTDMLYKIIIHNPDLKCENILTGFMPKKLGEVIIKISGISVNDTVSSLKKENITLIVKNAKELKFDISAARGFEDAQVTAGGADTREFSRETMESLKHKGLYCIGEMMNVDGMCGGYNLFWAWSSGRLCGENLI